MMPADSPAARLAALYDPEFVRAAGHRLADLLTEHFRKVQNRETPVLNWRHPAENVADAGSYLDAATALPTACDADAVGERFAELVRTALSRGQNLHSPRYVGHQVPPPVPIAGLFDAVSSATNQPMAIYEMGPWATAIETALIERLGARLGYPEGTFAGFITHGGSIANLTALLTARNVALDDAWEAGLTQRRPAPVLVAHAEAHYCISRAAGILGLGTRQIVKPPLDDRRRMDPHALDAALTDLRRSGTPIIAVAASACATPIGAFDPLDSIADVCEKHGVWLHVDAAHGGSAIFSERHRHLLAGIERADSVVWDAHKMMHVPALCTFVFYRNREHRFEAFRQEAPYLFDPSDPGLAEYDSGLKTLECTKRGAAFGLWGLWSLFGESIFGDLVDATFDLARTFYEKLSAADDFVPLHEPQCNILAFRHVPVELRNVPGDVVGRFQLELRKEIVRSGSFYIVPTSRDGVPALRCTVMNPLTTPADLDALMNELRACGQALISAK
ncbi:MAG: pyridoxal-dependent decarboxylase [Planctomycetaceae bacterium]